MQKGLKIAVVGASGYVGREQVRLFKDYEPYEYDRSVGTKEGVNECDVAFICVPTPMKEDGSCDISIVKEVLGWLKCPLVIIRSTVEPGTTDILASTYAGDVVFQPEYVGETVAHPLNDTRMRNFLIFGGHPWATQKAAEVYQMVYNASTRILQTTAKTAEVIKYMENSFIGTYVTFCNEFFDIANHFGVDYHTVREGFLLDPRMTPFWTFVFPNKRGFDGKCIPKDMNAIVASCERTKYRPELLKAVLSRNKQFNDKNV